MNMRNSQELDGRYCKRCKLAEFSRGSITTWLLGIVGVIAASGILGGASFVLDTVKIDTKQSEQIRTLENEFSGFKTFVYTEVREGVKEGIKDGVRNAAMEIDYARPEVNVPAVAEATTTKVTPTKK